MFHMKMRLEKPEIAKRAGKEGKIYSFGKEIWRFILVFLIGSFIAGLIPAIYEMYLFLSDVEMFDQLQRLFLNDDSSFSDMMELATDMTDGMYILTLFCTLILIISVLVYCNKIEKRSYYSMGLVKKDGAKHYVQGLLVGAVSFSLCVLAGAALGFVDIKGWNQSCNLLIVLLYFIGFLVQGFSEEIAFRGYFMISLMKRSSAVKAVLVNSLAFAFCHMLNPGLTILAFLNLLLIGIFLSLYVIKTNDIWGAAGYHSMWNFVQGTFYGISVSGTNVGSAVLSSEIKPGNIFLTGGKFGMEGSIVATVVMAVVLVLGMLYYNRKETKQNITG